MDVLDEWWFSEVGESLSFGPVLLEIFGLRGWFAAMVCLVSDLHVMIQDLPHCFCILNFLVYDDAAVYKLATFCQEFWMKFYAIVLVCVVG